MMAENSGGSGIIPTFDMSRKAGDNDSGFGNGASWIWIILIFALLGGGLGFGRDGWNRGGHDGVVASPATNLINNDFLYTQQKMDGLAREVGALNVVTNQNLTNGFNGVQMALCNLGHQMAACCYSFMAA